VMIFVDETGMSLASQQFTTCRHQRASSTASRKCAPSMSSRTRRRR
jgi:hypothetical protein